MIKFNFVPKSEVESFSKEGAKVQASFIFNDADVQSISADKLELMGEIYQNSAIRSILATSSEILSRNIEEYHKDEVAAVISSIAETDPEMYQNIIYFIQASLQIRDRNAYSEYIEKINDISKPECDCENCDCENNCCDCEESSEVIEEDKDKNEDSN